MREEWRPVVGYEGCYEVSYPKARVRRVARTFKVVHRFGLRRGLEFENTVRGRVLVPGKSRCRNVKLYRGGEYQILSSITLMRQAFPDKEIP